MRARARAPPPPTLLVQLAATFIGGNIFGAFRLIRMFRLMRVLRLATIAKVGTRSP